MGFADKLDLIFEDKITGGLSDGKTAQDIAKKHKVPLESIEKQIEMGVKVEAEHTGDKSKALEITKDHLWEIGDYYTRLDKMEKSAKK